MTPVLPPGKIEPLVLQIIAWQTDPSCEAAKILVCVLVISKHAVGLVSVHSMYSLSKWMPSVYAAVFSACVAQPCCCDARELPI